MNDHKIIQSNIMNYNLGEVLKRFTLQKTTYYDNLIIFILHFGQTKTRQGFAYDSSSTSINFSELIQFFT